MSTAYTLILGNTNYSSWSMRAWLLLRFLGIPFEEIKISLYTPTSRAEVKALGGQSGLVPVLKHHDMVIWDSLAIVETLYETYPAIWPDDRERRAVARSLCCEVHAGLNCLREAMPTNIRARVKVEIAEAVWRDIDRVVEIWSFCARTFDGPWLMGEFCAADIFMAPIATRFQTYGVTLDDPAAVSYGEKILRHPLVAAWCEAAEKDPTTIGAYD